MWWDESSPDILTYVMETTSRCQSLLHMKPIGASIAAQTSWGLSTSMCWRDPCVLNIFFLCYILGKLKWMVQLFSLPLIEVTLMGIAFCFISLATAPVCFWYIPYWYWDQVTLAVGRKVEGGKLLHFYLTFQRKHSDSLEMPKHNVDVFSINKKKIHILHHWSS